MRLPRERAARRRLAALGACAAAALTAGAVLGAGDRDGGTGIREPPERAGRQPLERQVGQLLVSSFDGTSPPAYVLRRLRAGQTAGVILFRKNVASPAALRSLTGRLHRAGGGAALVAVDQEGGQIRSVPSAGPSAPQAAQGPPESVEAVARRAAGQLRALGVNVNLAPVADVPEGPGSAMSSRAFAGAAGAVAARAAAAVRGLAAGGVAAAPKHFPGLGAAVRNTDDAPVTLPRDRAALERDLLPFREAIAEGAPIVMASHALYPSLDGRRIASQSRSILAGLLRRRLGFRGVVVTDSIEAEAVLRRSPVAVAAERSIAAGADLVLMTGSGSWKLVYPRLLRRARRSAPFRRRVAEAAGRVTRLKRALR